ncbi:hypothetical protein VTN02DRAFT_405 [Thermoascus thermophilus]
MTDDDAWEIQKGCRAAGVPILLTHPPMPKSSSHVPVSFRHLVYVTVWSDVEPTPGTAGARRRGSPGRWVRCPGDMGPKHLEGKGREGVYEEAKGDYAGGIGPADIPSTQAGRSDHATSDPT